MDGGVWWAAVHWVTKSWARLSDFTFLFHFHALKKEMATHSSVLAWRIPGTGEPGGLPSMGSHRVGHDWSDLAAAANRSEVLFFFFVVKFLKAPFSHPNGEEGWRCSAFLGAQLSDVKFQILPKFITRDDYWWLFLIVDFQRCEHVISSMEIKVSKGEKKYLLCF